MMTSYAPDWRESGVRIVPHDRLDSGTPQTPGMHREAAISRASAGAERIWAGTVTIEPGAMTGPHHHGPLESVIYVVSVISYTSPHVPHQEINASEDGLLSCVVVRSDQEPVVVNLDIVAVQDPLLIR
jgi:uncharacterized RmlC-like cupin family protein